MSSQACVVFIYFPFTWRQFTFRFLRSVRLYSLLLLLDPLSLSRTWIFYCYCFLPLVQPRRVIKMKCCHLNAVASTPLLLSGTRFLEALLVAHFMATFFDG